MLNQHSATWDGDPIEIAPASTAGAPDPSRFRAVHAPAIDWERSAYRATGGAHPAALIGSVGFVAALLSALLYLGVTPVRHATQDLHVVDLSVTPPPPPPPPAPRPTEKLQVEPTKPVIVAPPPIVPVPAPAPQIVTIAAPPPPQAVVVAPAPAAPPSRPAPAPADAGDLSSKMISATPPSYPIESRRSHEQGVVVLMVLLSTEGRVEDISVSQSSGFERLDHAALAAVRHWRWSPTLRDGTAMEVRGLVKIPFVLKS